MEEYRDLELTLAVFRRVLDEDRLRRHRRRASCCRPTCPTRCPALEELCAWARERRDRAGGWIKVRLVKGRQSGDGAGRRRAARLAAGPVRHQGRDRRQLQAHARRAARSRQRRRRPRRRRQPQRSSRWPGPSPRPSAARRRRPGRVRDARGHGAGGGRGGARPASAVCLLYAPIVGPRRHRGRHRLPGAPARREQRARTTSSPTRSPCQVGLAGLGDRGGPLPAVRWPIAHRLLPPTRRIQDRGRARRAGPPPAGAFANEPDTDFSIAANRDWIAGHLADRPRRRAARVPAGGRRPDRRGGGRPRSASTRARPRRGRPTAGCRPTWPLVERAVARRPGGRSRVGGHPGRSGGGVLRGRGRRPGPPAGRAAGGHGLSTPPRPSARATPRCRRRSTSPPTTPPHIPDAGSGFRPHGTVVVASPWNFPLSIPAGGVLGRPGRRATR